MSVALLFPTPRCCTAENIRDEDWGTVVVPFSHQWRCLYKTGKTAARVTCCYMRCCATRHPSIASKRWHCCPKSHTSGGSRASQSSLQQFLWISVQEWPLLRCISKTEAGWDESETGTMWRQEGSQVTTASSPSLWAVSFNIYSHGGSLNPDSWKIFTPVSLCIRTAKRTIDRQPKKNGSGSVGLDRDTWNL